VATRWLTPPPSRAVVRFAIPPSPSINQGFQSLAWSPDGSRLVYLTNLNQGERHLMLRTMGDLEARPIAGASGQVSSPTFSPNGQFVAFYAVAEGVLKKIAITGGTSVTLCKMTTPYSGPAWHPSGIVFAQTRGVMRVSPDGGEPELIVKLGDGERIAAPQLIDDRGTLLFSYTSEASLFAGWDKGQVIVQSADGTRQVIAAGSDARYLPSGHIVYMSGSTLMGVPFDAGSRQVRGTPVPVVEGIARASTQLFAGLYAMSPSGALAYVAAAPPAAAARRTLALVDMNGKAQPLPAPPNAYLHPRVSPDGTRVAVATDDGKEGVISIYDLSGGSVLRRLTFEGRSSAPIWSPDSQTITFQSVREGHGGLFRQRADGSGTAERLTTFDTRGHFPESWSRDGKTLTFGIGGDALFSVWTWSSDGDRTPKLLIEGAPAAVTSELSPDGRWLAYGSNELNKGGFQVFVQPFPLTGAKFLVNPLIASTPVWSRDGKRLFFAYNNRIFSAAIQTTPAFAAGEPVEIKMPNIMASNSGTRHFDLMPDGKHLLVVMPADADSTQQSPTLINVVLNWLDELKAKTATQP
jgi:Tol biopolymer transport system component